MEVRGARQEREPTVVQEVREGLLNTHTVLLGHGNIKDTPSLKFLVDFGVWFRRWIFWWIFSWQFSLGKQK